MIHALLLVLAAGCDGRDAIVYVIPPTYEGWVVVEYGIPGLEPAPLQQGVRVIRPAADGRARTGTALDSVKPSNVVSDGRVLPNLELERVGYDAAYTTVRDTRFVCCTTYRVHQAQGTPERTFDRFYVGRGPAGEPPPVP